MPKITLPYRHYYYLKILSSLRRETVQQAIEFLYANIDESADNWINTRFAHYDKPAVDIDVSSIRAKVNEISLMRKIQALPPGIKPVTDGLYSLDIKFEEDEHYTIICLLGYKIYDFRRRDDEIINVPPIYNLVKDKFPFSMTTQQYDVYRRVGSQFWRLIRDNDQETMPQEGGISMDVGCYVGLRALAMHYCVGPNGKVYAIEVEDENYKLLKRNIEVNHLKNIFPIQEAVDFTSRTATLYTRRPQSMSHGLKNFKDIEDPTILTANWTSYRKEVATITMDDLFKKYAIEKVDNMHISVTGHEIEVLNGINTILPQLKKVRVSCPYKTNGIPNIETAKEILEQKGFSNFTIHGSAIIGER